MATVKISKTTWLRKPVEFNRVEFIVINGRQVQAMVPVGWTIHNRAGIHPWQLSISHVDGFDCYVSTIKRGHHF